MYADKLALRKRLRRAGRGAVLIEFAFIFLILVMFIFAVVQWGILINAINTVEQFSREGARYAAVHGTESTSDASIKSYISTVAGGTMLAYSDLTITISPTFTDKDSNGNYTRVSGQPITVKVVYPLYKKYFFPAGFIPGTTANKTTTKQSTFIIEPL